MKPQEKEIKNRSRSGLSVKEITLFAFLGALMFASKMIMEILPNMHLLAMFIALYTIVFRKKALYPIYVFVLVTGIYSGFAVWWVPYLYIWTVLWGVVMLLPKNMSRPVQAVVYPIVCSLHGFLFGILYAPAQALFFGLNFEQTLAWIAAGLYFDLIHGISNLFAGILVLPLKEAIGHLEKSLHKR